MKTGKKKVFIIHFQPLELFPPAMNMIDFLGSNTDLQLIVVTNKKAKSNSLSLYTNASDNVRIYRPSMQSASPLLRYLNYFLFYTISFLLLLRYNTAIVWYIETLSSLPAVMYKKMKGTKVNLMVHYHEYTEPGLYKGGMFLSRWMYKLEFKMYQKYSWISHTNPVRLQMFKDDNNLNDYVPDIFHVMPNYPPSSWLKNRNNRVPQNGIKKMVFVGSLGYDNMYLQEVIDWLSAYKNTFLLDVYSYNIDAKARKVLEDAGQDNIKYCGGCDYQNLPEVLKDYDIGLVIYKPFSQNTIHAVSNKVFEYFACGLDVWFSQDMTYTFKYTRENGYPKILPVNFQQMDSFDYRTAISRDGVNYAASNYFYENIYPEILHHIQKV